MYVCIWIYVYIYIICVYMDICIHMYNMYVYMYIHIYIYIYIFVPLFLFLAVFVTRVNQKNGKRETRISGAIIVAFVARRTSPRRVWQTKNFNKQTKTISRLEEQLKITG